MKRILITGENSYIGTSFKTWIEQYKEYYQIETISVRESTWKDVDFSVYDVLIHLAAIVHVKETNEELYYKVNRDLAIKIAEKAKKEHVQHFIFFSTMSVFGVESGSISAKTKINPKTPYGKSKREAEIQIERLATDSFKVAIIRPPMIYGPQCVGNYQRLSNVAKKINVFPKVNNKRSMLYIDNLHCFVKVIIDNQLNGTFHPQNIVLVNTSLMVNEIAKFHSRNIYLIKGFDTLISKLSEHSKLLQKVFGTLFYDSTLEGYPESIFNNVKFDYQIRDFKTSIEESEK